jgi:hypothetical protein
MPTKQQAASLIAAFLCERCRELGFIPLLTTVPPANRYFYGHDRNSPTALYVKLFGHNSDILNSTQARWGLIDTQDLNKFGSLGEDNLTLTQMDKYLLIVKFAEEFMIELPSANIMKLSYEIATIQQLLDKLFSH